MAYKLFVLVWPNLFLVMQGIFKKILINFTSVVGRHLLSMDMPPKDFFHKNPIKY
jgi:hypothetical protein